MNLANQNAPATPKQLIALYYGTGLNTKGLTITLGKAHNLISDMKNGIDITEELRALGATGTAKVVGAVKENQFKDLYNTAHQAGMTAVENFIPNPMTVVGGGKEYFVADGPCGFAEIVIKPATTSFAKWLMKNKLASKRYNGGISIWVHQFNQSVQKKEKYATAFAKVLSENGIKAYADSRLD